MEQESRYVYHGSTQQGLKTIRKNISSHGKSWVYGTLSKALATIFISDKGCDLYYSLSGAGTKESPVTLVERKEGMFEEIFHVSGSLEVVSEYDEEVISEEHIDHVFEKLKEFNDQGEIKLYLFPDRPDFIPKDNSDLIPKVIKWQNNGFNIDKFFQLYPELKDLYFEELEKYNKEVEKQERSFQR